MLYQRLAAVAAITAAAEATLCLKDDGSSTVQEVKACVANTETWLWSYQEYDADRLAIDEWVVKNKLADWYDCYQSSGAPEYSLELSEDGKTKTGECYANQDVIDCNEDKTMVWMEHLANEDGTIGGCYTAEKACLAHADQGFVWGNDGTGDYCVYECLEAPALAHAQEYEYDYTLSGCS